MHLWFCKNHTLQQLTDLLMIFRPQNLPPVYTLTIAQTGQNCIDMNGTIQFFCLTDTGQYLFQCSLIGNLPIQPRIQLVEAYIFINVYEHFMVYSHIGDLLYICIFTVLSKLQDSSVFFS